VIDDDSDVTLLLSEWLGARGYQVRALTDDLSAFYQALDFLPELIIMDVRMPYMNGWTEARLFQDDPRLRGVPIILVSADATALEHEVPLGFPIYGRLLKPFSRHELLKTVDEAL